MASMRDVVPYNRPNWTTPPEMPAAPAAPGTAVAVSTRPNWTTPVPPTPSARDVSGATDAVLTRDRIRNPNVGPNGSVEAAAFRAPPNSGPQMPAGAAPAGPAAAPADPGTGWQRAWRSMRAGATSTADTLTGAGKTTLGTGKALGVAVIPGAAGAAVGALQSAADANQPEPEPFVPPAAKPGDIPIGGDIAAPKPIERHPLGFGPNNEFTRNLANTINAASGLGRGVGAGVGALSNFFRSGSNAAVAAEKATPALRSVAPFAQGAQAGQALTAGSFGPETPAAPTFPPNSQGQPGGTAPGMGVTPAPNPNGTIRRVGNSYSGEGTIRFGADIDDPRNPGAGVTVLPAGPTMRGAPVADQPQGPTLGGFNTTEQIGMNRLGGTATFGPSLSVLGASGTQRPRDIRAANALASERAIATERMNNERGIASMREGGEMARANLSVGVQRENNALNRDVTMRGQDITREGQYLTMAQAQAAARRAQANTDREFDRNVRNDDFSQQSAAQADHNKWVETTFTTRDADGKTVPDAQKIGDFNNAAQATIGTLVARLRQSGDPAAAAKAEKLAQRGLAGLDAEDRALLKTLYDRRERFVQTRGVGPFSSSGAVSNNLYDFALTGRTDGLVQNTVQMAGGQSMPEKHIRFTEPGNTILPDWFKTPTTALGPTPQEQARMREGSR
jgi:hypothetical protein